MKKAYILNTVKFFSTILVWMSILISHPKKTDKTKEWEDGKTYPYYPLDVSSASHPFTQVNKILDTGGRVQKFEKDLVRNHEQSLSSNW